MKEWSAYPIRFLLASLCERPELLPAVQKAAAGEVARGIFEFAISRNPRDGNLLRTGIETVCRTYDSDPPASSALLSSLLTKESLATHGHEDLPVLAREAERLISVAPDFVRSIYRAGFSHEETRTDQTAMGAGRIMPLTSNRRQDYTHGLWQLGETYPKFLRRAPKQAIDALNDVLAAHNSYPDNDPLQNEVFEFLGFPAQFQPDGSYIWDSTMHRHEAHLKMLDALEEELHRAAHDPQSPGADDRILSLIAQKCSLASVWRQVLHFGIRNPEAVAKRFVALASSLPVLKGVDSSSLAGNLITGIYPTLSPDERARIEAAILSIPDASSPTQREGALRIRNRLLGCIPESLAATEGARSVIAELQQAGGPPPNIPPFQIQSSFEAYTESRFLADRGVAVEAEANRKISTAAKPLEDFAKSFSENVSAETLQANIGHARNLQSILIQAPREEAHELQIEIGLNHLVTFCKYAAKCRTLDCNTEDGRFVVEVLMAASEHSSPVYNPKWAADFDDHATWSSAPRIDAAEGLIVLASRVDSTSPTILRQVERLSKDPVPAVRLHISDFLNHLRNTAPDETKIIIGEMAATDPSSSVVESLLVRQIYPLVHFDREEARRLATIIFNRTDLKGEAAAKVRMDCVGLFQDLYLLDDVNLRGNLIDKFADDVLEYTAENGMIVSRIRDVLVAGPIQPIDPIAERVRLRSFALLAAIVRSAQNAFVALKSKNSGASEWTSEDKAKATSIAQIVDNISSQLFFASGSFESNSKNPEDVVSVEQKQRFLRESSDLVDLLCSDPHPSTVHHMVQMFKALLNIAPKEVFLKIGQVVAAGQRGGYQFESLAIGEIVDVVNKVLADFRPLLQTDERVRESMILILNVFVKAGWPQALQLTYRLDEVFR
jgi:hypothetical protein